MQIRISRVTQAEHPLLRALYALYLHDLSEHGGPYALDSEGTWVPDYVPSWLEGNDQQHALLLRERERPVGFACVGLQPFRWMSADRDLRLAEFFILRAERRCGLGAACARALFDLYRGRWEVTELPDNAPAIRFWRGVIRGYTGGAFEEREVDGGPAQWFDNRPRSG